MATTAQQLDAKSFDTPDETRTFANGKLDIVEIGGTAIGRATFQPGWKWSESVKPIANTKSCEAQHLGYFVSGSMTVVMDDGTRITYNAGDVMSIPPGHDAWIEGNEPCVAIDFVGFKDYAKP
jgi:EutQ-like cupin domain